MAAKGFLVAGKAVAVTGAGGGIGRSLCRSLARAGARRVLALDLDLAGATDTAALCAAEAPGCAVHAERCDAFDGPSLRSALAAAAPLDLFCANAGIAVGSDCSATPAAEWQLAWSGNVMQLAWGAQELVPGMIERGGGALMVTSSAAGLLSQLGSAPYTTSKHAAVGLAEWLSITHGDDGLHVCCVCPQGVRTDMALRALEQGPPAMRALAVDGLLSPDDVAEEAVAALEQGTFLCMPGGDKGPARHVARKAADREGWMASMRKLQRRLLRAD